MNVTEEISVDDWRILYEGDPPLCSVLTNAVSRGDHGEVLSLLEKGADADDLDEALAEAVSERASTEVIGALIRAGADVNAWDWGGKTVLMRAAWHGYTEIVETLLDAGADASITDNRGHTAADLFSKKRSRQKSPALRRLREACGEHAESAGNNAGENLPDEG